MFPTGKGFPRTRNGFQITRNAFPTGKGFPTEISSLSGKRFLTGKWLPPWRGFPDKQTDRQPSSIELKQYKHIAANVVTGPDRK